MLPVEIIRRDSQLTSFQTFPHRKKFQGLAYQSPFKMPAQRQNSDGVEEIELGEYSQSQDNNKKELDSIVIISSWCRLQRTSLNAKESILTLLWRLIVFVFENASFVFVLLYGMWDSPDFYYDTELIASVGLWWISTFFATIMKFMDDLSIQNKRSFCLQVHDCFGNLLLPLKFVRYIRSYLNRAKQLEILERSGPGCDMSRSQLSSLVNIHRNELIDARYDLYETFIKSIPMALLQNYFLFRAHETFHLCNYTDVSRLVLVMVELFAAATSLSTFNWRKRSYESALHVYGQSAYNYRYSAHVRNQDRTSHMLETLCLFFSITARFYVISFFMAVHWALGVACLILLHFSNWLLIVLFPSLRENVENLPFGVSQPVCNFVDRWICIFAAKGTRFNQLTRKPFTYATAKARLPIVVTQILTFVVPFCLVYVAIRILGEEDLWFYANRSMIAGSEATGEVITNSTRCFVAGNWTEAIGPIRHINEALGSLEQLVNARFGSFNDFYNIFHLHWLLLYAHFLAALVYNCYVVTYNYTFDDYPAQLSSSFLRNAFLTIQNKEYPCDATKLWMVQRLLYLLSIDMKSFGWVSHERESRLAHKPKHILADWWKSRIKFEFRHKDNENVILNISDLNGSPLLQEFSWVYSILPEDDLVARSMFQICIEKVDSIMTKEMSSRRLVKTFELLELPKKTMYFQRDPGHGPSF